MFQKQYDLHIKYNKENVLEMTDCHKEDPRYPEYAKIFDGLVETYLSKIVAKGYIVVDSSKRCDPIKGDYGIYCLVTLGEAIDGCISGCFSNMEYLEGMLLNTLADDILFQCTDELRGLIEKDLDQDIIVDDSGKGLSDRFLTVRYEPGDEHVSMDNQKVIYDLMMDTYKLGMYLSDGYMLSPTKSATYYYGLTDSDCSNGLDHDCSNCMITDCPTRKFIINVNKGQHYIQVKRNENLLHALRSNGVFVDAPCSGKGICGKCKVQVKGHSFELNKDEKSFLTDHEIDNGVVLSCYHKVNENMDIFIGDQGINGPNIEADYKDFVVEEKRVNRSSDYGIAVDIGTTTLAVALIDLATGHVIDSRKQLNPQKPFGADVISRIMHVQEAKDNQLQDLIVETIETLTIDLMKSVEVTSSDKGVSENVEVKSESGSEIKTIKPLASIDSMVISGNTTMVYLLLGMDPSALAVAPFETVDLSLIQKNSDEIFKDLNGFSLSILPWISAYVGGDIVSGMYCVDLMKEKKNTLFIDIGTNGEMVLHTPRKTYCASTAAGPAFEGANIKCGTGSIKGAICELSADDELNFTYKVLGEGKGHKPEPIGICGSALVDAMAILVNNGTIEPSGFMKEAVTIVEDIRIYPEDVRQVQLAKAAIKAGIDVLLQRADLTYEDIDVLYMAGGFGKHIDPVNSGAIGLIPNELVDTIEVVGNTSLGGSVKYLMDNKGQVEVEGIRDQCEYIELSMDMDFNNAYIMNMGF